MSAWLFTGIASRVARSRDGRVVALLAGDEARRRVHGALGGEMTELACRTASDVELTVTAQHADCVLVTPWDDSGRPSVPTVRRLRSRFPWLPIAVYCQLEPKSAHEIAALTQAGADTFIISGYDDLGLSLRQRLAFAWSRRAAEDALAALAPWETPESAPILTYCLYHSAEPLTVHAVADALSIDRSTLGRRLAAASLPAAGHLISWCRLLCAARWLEDPDRTVEQAALVLGFGSGSALRNMYRRYVRLPPREVRARGGLTCVLSLLVRELSGEEGDDVTEASRGRKAGQPPATSTRTDEA
jgi:AraC-like DNA-binding protein